MDEDRIASLSRYLQRIETRLLVNQEERLRLEEQQSDLYREQNGVLKEISEIKQKWS